MAESVPTPEGPGPAGLLLSRDLIFTSKVTGTARMLGRQVPDDAPATPTAAPRKAMIEQWKPLAVFVDLAAGDSSSEPEALLAYRRRRPRHGACIAFGSHVDTASLAAASAAGCDPVLPRSKFSAELPELIRRFLGGDEPS